MKKEKKSPQVTPLFVFLMAALMSLVALSIDTILPAMGFIREKFEVSLSESHWILTSLFLGLCVGQVFFGSLSDCIGRKYTPYIGVTIFTLGSIVSYNASDYLTFVTGRIIQGFGIAAPRIVSQAIIRDVSSGNTMARLNSYVMTIFIMVPVFAPILGQVIIWTVYWNFIFIALVIYCIVLTSSFALKIDETLLDPRPFNLNNFWQGVFEVFSNRVTFGITIVIGCVFGCIVSFLNIAQYLYQNVYGVGDNFAFYFAGTAAVIGISSLSNAKLVSKFKLNTIISFSLIWVFLWSIVFLSAISYFQELSLLSFIIFSLMVFTTFGFLFSNLNALALEPMGHIAGTASAIIATFSNLTAISIGAISSNYFSDSAKPLIIVFVVTSLLAILIMTKLRIFSLRFW